MGICSQGALELGVSHTLFSLPSSAGRRVAEYGRDPCPEWVPVSPILGQDNPFKLKDNQTKAPLLVSQPKAHFQHLQKAAKCGHLLLRAAAVQACWAPPPARASG